MAGFTARKAALALIGAATLAGCEAASLAPTPVDQEVPMAFPQCLSRIEETAARIGQEPAVLAETSEIRIVRFDDEGEIVTVSCDALGGRMVVQTRPAPAAAPAAAI